MTSDFRDILIAEPDDSATTLGPDGLANVSLRLSATPPTQWAEHFDHRWREVIYPMKRKAWVERDRIVIHCDPAEVQTHHLLELRRIAAETNEDYRRHASGSAGASPK